LESIDESLEQIKINIDRGKYMLTFFYKDKEDVLSSVLINSKNKFDEFDVFKLIPSFY
jgi:hypothetical protein